MISININLTLNEKSDPQTLAQKAKETYDAMQELGLIVVPPVRVREARQEGPGELEEVSEERLLRLEYSKVTGKAKFCPNLEQKRQRDEGEKTICEIIREAIDGWGKGNEEESEERKLRDEYSKVTGKKKFRPTFAQQIAVQNGKKTICEIIREAIDGSGDGAADYEAQNDDGRHPYE